MVSYPVPTEIKEKLGTLLLTKKMNAAAFFSFSFKIGVYLPILAPLVSPFLLSFWEYVKARVFRKKVDSNN